MITKKSTGKGRIDWKYFKLLYQIFANDHTINSSFLMSSMTGKSARVLEMPLSPEPLSPIIDTIINGENTFINMNPAATTTPTNFMNISNLNNKTIKQSRLDLHRKHIREIEEKRVDALNRLLKGIEDQNIILREKNGLLKKLIDSPNFRL
ncbi:unnamed protein product [Psylliodes chrysocephalus]|uniref:Uncharacterized protein n=1 Tax=Psylliodes chrysocephalus TaxID=3402493 RepID=A0A9P0GFE9_9CUCU|nr:unnamed protein product [Psylliodes chrysocephala]